MQAEEGSQEPPSLRALQVHRGDERPVAAVVVAVVSGMYAASALSSSSSAAVAVVVVEVVVAQTFERCGESLTTGVW